MKGFIQKTAGHHHPAVLIEHSSELFNQFERYWKIFRDGFPGKNF